MHSLFGLELQPPVNFIVAFVVVLALIGAAAWAVRRFGATRLEAAARGRQPRLAVIDSAAVDGRRKLVIVRRDNVEHLLMIGGATDVVVETNIVRAGTTATRDAPAVREAPALRASVPVETLPRAMPLPDPTPWPLQPEPALAPAPVMRTERMRVVEEPAAAWPTHVEPLAAPVVAPAPPRPVRGPDTLAGLAAELSRPAPEPIRAPEPMPMRAPAPAPVAMHHEPQAQAADQNLAEMAQRLEAALRRPVQSAKPMMPEASVRVAAPAEDKRIEPKAAPRPTARPGPAAQAQAAQAHAAKPGFENLEQEMASLLGRPGKT